MSADRGTLTRGAYPPPDHDGRPQPTPPSARRPPSAPRERKPALAALALLLIVGGALGAAYLVIQTGHHVGAIEVTQPVGVGQPIPAAAMTEVQVTPSSGLAYIPWAEAAQVTRYYAASSIPAGTLLSSAMVAQASNLAAGRDEVGLALKDGQLPEGLQIGNHVSLFQVSDAPQSCPGTSGTELSANAIVLGVGQPGPNSNAIDVRVAVDPADAGAVTCNAANGNVGLAILPAAGAASAASGPSPSSTGPSSSASTRPAGHRRGAGHRAQPSSTPSPGTTP